MKLTITKNIKLWIFLIIYAIFVGYNLFIWNWFIEQNIISPHGFETVIGLLVYIGGVLIVLKIEK